MYDALGREIATLVNEEKQPGTYIMEWNADGFARDVDGKHDPAESTVSFGSTEVVSFWEWGFSSTSLGSC